LNNFPEIVNIIEKNKPDFKFDVYDSYIFLTGNGEPGQPGLGSGQAAFGDEIRNSTGNFNAVLMAGGYNGTYIWIHELGHSLYAFEDLYLFNPSASTKQEYKFRCPG